MIKEVQILLHPSHYGDYEALKKIAAQKLHLNYREITSVKIIKRSLDARMKVPHYVLRVLVFIGETPHEASFVPNYRYVNNSVPVIIVGSGPAGLFAALRLLELGIKPIILERGKDVHARRRDIAKLMKEGIVNEESNYSFGEGGAGAFSDGKLYTRSKKRGDVNKVLKIFVKFGAPADILIDARPHLGSNKLPKIIKNIRSTILEKGGMVLFEHKVTDLIVKENKIKGVVVNNSFEILADAVILAAGHSARDIYYLFNNRKWKIDFKEFAVGFRVEHPQNIIDLIQYHSGRKLFNLPAAYYNLTCQVNRKGVYSFCMCPGGIIIPASTNSNELVLNGMSVSGRSSPFANSGIVTSVGREEIKDFNKFGELAGIEFQKRLERKARELGGGRQVAPSQKVKDFVENKISDKLLPTSYLPGIVSVPLHEEMPEVLTERLKESLKIFNKKMKLKFLEKGQLLFPETRTSAPVRLVRNFRTLQHVNVEGLFPAGEGSGYAGGIVSSAVDGEKCADAATGYLGAT